MAEPGKQDETKTPKAFAAVVARLSKASAERIFADSLFNLVAEDRAAVDDKGHIIRLALIADSTDKGKIAQWERDAIDRLINEGDANFEPRTETFTNEIMQFAENNIPSGLDTPGVVDHFNALASAKEREVARYRSLIVFLQQQPLENRMKTCAYPFPENWGLDDSGDKAISAGEAKNFLRKFRKEIASEGTRPEWDMNGDGAVDASDVTIMQERFREAADNKDTPLIGNEVLAQLNTELDTIKQEMAGKIDVPPRPEGEEKQPPIPNIKEQERFCRPAPGR